MDIYETAFRKAALLLSASGAEYAIVFKGKEHTSADCQYAMVTKDGALHGPLPIHHAKRQMRGPRVSRKDTGYKAAVDNLGVGANWKYVAVDYKEAVMVQKCTSAYASVRFGSGNYLTTVNGNTLEVLRLK